MENSTTQSPVVTEDQGSIEEQVNPVVALAEEEQRESAENSPTEGITTHIRGAIESLLFVNERPVTLDQMKKVLKTVSALDIKKIIQNLQKEYEDKNGGMTIKEIAGGYQMLSNSKYVSYIRDFYKTKHKEKLSKPALESLAIIAYKQPVTRGDIELIRGVNSDGVAAHLLNKELIKVVGRKDVPGRPYLYGTTKQFLEYFGLKSVDNLPRLEEFPALLEPAETEVSLEKEKDGGEEVLEKKESENSIIEAQVDES